MNSPFHNIKSEVNATNLLDDHFDDATINEEYDVKPDVSTLLFQDFNFKLDTSTSVNQEVDIKPDVNTLPNRYIDVTSIPSKELASKYIRDPTPPTVKFDIKSNIIGKKTEFVSDLDIDDIKIETEISNDFERFPASVRSSVLMKCDKNETLGSWKNTVRNSIGIKQSENGDSPESLSQKLLQVEKKPSSCVFCRKELNDYLRKEIHTYKSNYEQTLFACRTCNRKFCSSQHSNKPESLHAESSEWWSDFLSFHNSFHNHQKIHVKCSVKTTTVNSSSLQNNKPTRQMDRPPIKEGKYTTSVDKPTRSTMKIEKYARYVETPIRRVGRPRKVNKLYCCHICSVKFHEKESLLQHLKMDAHETSVETFKRRLKIKIKENQFCCNFCVRKFSQKCTLLAHLKSHMKKLRSRQKDPNINVQYCCNVCDEKFHFKSSLVKHLKFFHFSKH